VIHFRPTLGLAEGDTVIIYWEECFLGCHFIHLEFYRFSLSKRVWVNTRKVKPMSTMAGPLEEEGY